MDESTINMQKALYDYLVDKIYNSTLVKYHSKHQDRQNMLRPFN